MTQRKTKSSMILRGFKVFPCTYESPASVRETSVNLHLRTMADSHCKPDFFFVFIKASPFRFICSYLFQLILIDYFIKTYSSYIFKKLKPLRGLFPTLKTTFGCCYSSLILLGDSNLDRKAYSEQLTMTFYEDTAW